MKQMAKLSGHAGAIYSLTKGRSENTLLSGSADGMIAEWDIQSLVPSSFSIKIGKPVYALMHVHENSILIAGTGNGDMHVIDLSLRKEIHFIQLHRSAIYRFAINKNRTKLVAVSGDGTISIWDLSSFKLWIHLPFTNEKIRSVFYDENLIYIGCGDGFIRVIEDNNFNILHEWKAHEMGVNSISKFSLGMHLSQNSDYLITGGKDAHLNIWNKEHQLIKSIPAHNFAIYAIEFHPEKNIFATAGRDKTVKIWDTENYNVLHRLTHKHSVNAIQWHEEKLIAVGDDRCLTIWE